MNRKKYSAHLAEEILKFTTPHAQWKKSYTELEQLAAKAALMQVHTILKNTPVAKRPPLDAGYFEYILFLLWIKRELETGDYRMACNELQKLIHFKHIDHPGVSNNVVALLATYLE